MKQRKIRRKYSYKNIDNKTAYVNRMWSLNKGILSNVYTKEEFSKKFNSLYTEYKSDFKTEKENLRTAYRKLSRTSAFISKDEREHQDILRALEKTGAKSRLYKDAIRAGAISRDNPLFTFRNFKYHKNEKLENEIVNHPDTGKAYHYVATVSWSNNGYTASGILVQDNKNSREKYIIIDSTWYLMDYELY